jgi:hypothetical protein
MVHPRNVMILSPIFLCHDKFSISVSTRWISIFLSHRGCRRVFALTRCLEPLMFVPARVCRNRLSCSLAFCFISLAAQGQVARPVVPPKPAPVHPAPAQNEKPAGGAAPNHEREPEKPNVQPAPSVSHEPATETRHSESLPETPIIRESVARKLPRAAGLKAGRAGVSCVIRHPCMRR